MTTIERPTVVHEGDSATRMATLEFAQKVFPAGSIIGPKEIRESCGIIPDGDETLLFSEATLALALLDHDLIFEPHGMTMRDINELFKGKTSTGTPLLLDSREYRDEEFFMDDELPGGWHLVARDVIPGSQRKNFWQHAGVIADHVNGIHQGSPPPIKNHLDLRPRPVQLFWRLAISERRGDRLMVNSGGLTKGRTSKGLSVCMGLFRPPGIAVGFLQAAACEEHFRIGIPFSYNGKHA